MRLYGRKDEYSECASERILIDHFVTESGIKLGSLVFATHTAVQNHDYFDSMIGGLTKGDKYMVVSTRFTADDLLETLIDDWGAAGEIGVCKEGEVYLQTLKANLVDVIQKIDLHLKSTPPHQPPTPGSNATKAFSDPGAR